MSAIVRTRLSPATLAWARVSSGFEVDEIARSVGVSIERYSEWEAGQDRPTFRQLLKIANKVKRPIALFYLHQPPPEPLMPTDFRIVGGIKQSKYSPELRIEIRKADRLQLLLAVLSEELGMPKSAGFPRINQNDDPDEAAAAIRVFLGFSVEQQLAIGDPASLYREWRDSIFSKGVIPIQFGVDRDQALGFALWHDYAPLVAVNTRQSAEAKTFTLLHELAHIALRMSGVSDASIPFREVAAGKSHSAIEAFCNRIAAATLLPADSSALAKALDSLTREGTLDLDSFRKQARRFGVSKYALAYRMAVLRPDLDSKVQAAVSKWFAFDNAQRPKVKKSGPIPPSTMTLGKRGQAFSRTVLRAVRESRISTEDARDLLDLEPHHFAKLEEKVFKSNDGEEGAD